MTYLTEEQAVLRIFEELNNARTKHPDYPADLIHRASIINEEAGELTKLCNDHTLFSEDNDDKTHHMQKEALHVIVTALRFLTGR